MEIGVVGSGIAGLAAAWFMSRSGHNVSIFEKQPVIGMASHSRDVQSASGSKRAVSLDVPLRLVNPYQWPATMELYAAAGIEVTQVDSSQNYSQLGLANHLRIDFSTLFDSVAKSLTRTVSRRIANDILRFRKSGLSDLEHDAVGDIQFGKYIDSQVYSSEFVYGFLFPVLSSTVCTCSYEALSQYPARIVLEALKNIVNQTQRRPPSIFRATYGSRDVVSRLTVPVQNTFTSVAVRSVREKQGRVELTYDEMSANESKSVLLDHVVIATQANQLLQILPDATDDERKLASSFSYEDVEIVLHSDAELMPPNQRSWATFNIISNATNEAAMCSILLSKFIGQSLSPEVIQTINPIIEPDHNKIIERCVVQRPVVDSRSYEGWELARRLNAQADRKIWFTGSYANEGVPLLENGVRESCKIVQRIISEESRTAQCAS